MRRAILTVFAFALFATSAGAQTLSPDEARAIARDAYVYGFPLVDNYRIQYSYFVDRANPEFKGAWNQVHNTARVYTPDDKAIQSPNSDTPYSFVGADLRAEPLVFTVPDIEQSRYYSLQFIDMATFNFGYIGSRATGNKAGKYLLAGPGWKGEKPDGINAVLRSETDFAFVIYRTQLFGPDDLDKVKAIQSGYKVQPLSQFEGKPAPAAPTAINFIKPLTPAQQRNSPEFFNILNFVLQFCPVDPSEVATRARFARLGIEAGKTFDAAQLPPDIRQAVQDGMNDAWKTFEEVKIKQDKKELTPGDMVGTRGYLNNNYPYRMAAAVLGIYGNSKEEAIYPVYFVDATGQKLDGSRRYALRLAQDQLPPVNAFWSLTLYELPASLLYANTLNRYVINSPMLSGLKRDADGGITIHVQHDSPGKDTEANWLPAPSGPFLLAMRVYWPKPEALNGAWKSPPLQQTN